jgi:hypothetical protein
MMMRLSSTVDKEVVPPEQIKCKKYACSLQNCLAKRNHQIEQCRGHFEAWEDCAAIVRGNIAAELERRKDDAKAFD